jgi:hypothetical protein
MFDVFYGWIRTNVRYKSQLCWQLPRENTVYKLACYMDVPEDGRMATETFCTYVVPASVQ